MQRDNIAHNREPPQLHSGWSIFTVNLAERKLSFLMGYFELAECRDREEMGFARAQPILQATSGNAAWY
ncbi:hypothetical protein XH89_20965 [Bradyrhizobium sp. CCBAU 53340]|nr:hypothetical protein XH89_20965 [Bradyrhizobium sp. CCBAU 53340]